MIERLDELALLMQGELNGDGDVRFSGVSIDTRTLAPGQLFFALKGNNLDGHDFVAKAAKAGAAAAIVERFCKSDLPQIRVDSAMDAMEALARRQRRDFFGAVIAITGSTGKTTVKEMLRAVLEQVGPVLAPIRSYNNRLGLCLTLCSLNPRQRFAVLELGANAPGEIAALADIARPRTAILTNAGRAHLEGFGSRAGVAKAKGELIDALPPEGWAVLPADEAFFLDWRRRAGSRRVIAYGSCELAESRLVCCQSTPDGLHIELDSLGKYLRCELKLSGRHNAINAAAVAAVALSLGAPVSAVETGLAQVQAVEGRLKHLPGFQGSDLYDDSYNANPESVRSAIDFLSERKGRRLLILGDMAELGSEAAELHREIGQYAGEKGIEQLYALGEMAAQSASAFGPSGGHTYMKVQELADRVREELEPDTTVLVKGSRSARMERVVELLREPG